MEKHVHQNLILQIMATSKVDTFYNAVVSDLNVFRQLVDLCLIVLIKLI
jgi:hypothetical protein